ncbi:MAG: hypothetical protein AB7U20_07940, partial [Planctomycetaceae bacterium]
LDIVTNGSGTIGLFGQMINNLTVGGTSSIDSTGGAAVQVGGASLINMTFSDISVTSSEDGIGFGNGISLGTIAGGTFDVTGTTSIQGAADMGRRGILITQSTGTFTFADVDIANTDGEGIAIFGMGGGGVNVTGTTTVTNAGTHGILINEATGNFTFADVDIDVTGGDGIAVGTPSGNPGTVNINGGTVNGTMGNGVTGLNAAGFNLNNTVFTNTTGFTISLTGSTVSGAGNSTVPAAAFSSDDGGGNAGMILFNGGADSAP